MIRSLEKHDKTLLAQMSLFRNVGLESVEVYLEKCEYGTLPAGEILLSPEKKNNFLFLLFSGQLTVHIDSIENEPLIVLEPGECVGEMSIIDRGVPSAYVVAAKESRVLIIDQEILWSLIKASHEVARNLLYILSRRVREGNISLSDAPELRDDFAQGAIFDTLTGLYNRRWLTEIFERIQRRCMMNKRPLSLVMLSIDHFKGFIALHNYLAADLALGAVARTLRQHMRPKDMAVRFSGEQFVLVLPGTSLEKSFPIMARLKEEIAKTKINVEGRFNLSIVTASLGVAQMKDHQTLESFLADADAALARAVAQGGNCIAK